MQFIWPLSSKEKQDVKIQIITLIKITEDIKCEFHLEFQSDNGKDLKSTFNSLRYQKYDLKINQTVMRLLKTFTN